VVGTSDDRPLRVLATPAPRQVTADAPQPPRRIHEATTTPNVQPLDHTVAVEPQVQRFDRPTHTAAPPRPGTDSYESALASASTGPAPDAGSIAVAAGIGYRAPDGSVVFGAPHSDEPAALQRAVEVHEMTVDAAPAAPPPPTGEAATPSSAAATPSAPAAAAGPAAAAAGGAPNLDELARRLYDPLAARIKAELRLDRERFGLVTDLRRP
jgi:hypothetical protein